MITLPLLAQICASAFTIVAGTLWVFRKEVHVCQHDPHDHALELWQLKHLSVGQQCACVHKTHSTVVLVPQVQHLGWDNHHSHM